jgi:hypothetical protein
MNAQPGRKPPIVLATGPLIGFAAAGTAQGRHDRDAPPDRAEPVVRLMRWVPVTSPAHRAIG